IGAEIGGVVRFDARYSIGNAGDVGRDVVSRAVIHVVTAATRLRMLGRRTTARDHGADDKQDRKNPVGEDQGRRRCHGSAWLVHGNSGGGWLRCRTRGACAAKRRASSSVT